MDKVNRGRYLSLEFFSSLTMSIVSSPQSGKCHLFNLACLSHIMRKSEDEEVWFMIEKKRVYSSCPQTLANIPQQMFYLLQPTQVVSRLSHFFLTSLTFRVSGSETSLPTYPCVQITLSGGGWEIGKEINETLWWHDHCGAWRMGTWAFIMPFSPLLYMFAIFCNKKLKN